MATPANPEYETVTRMAPFLAALLLAASAQGRADLPRQYVPASGRVSLARTMPFYQAVRALSEISGRLERKVIIDDHERPFPIDVEIDDMWWRDALDIIARLHGLRVDERDDYLRILDPASSDAAPAAAARASRYGADVREVHISAIFFEGDRRELRDRGINWGAVVKRGDWFHGLEHPVPGQLGVNVLRQPQQEAAAGGGAGGGADEGGSEQLREGVTAMIRALESQSVGRCWPTRASRSSRARRGGSRSARTSRSSRSTSPAT